MNAPALQPLAYVCIVSEFNLPELEACLARRPSDVLLVVSDNARFAEAAARLEKRLHAQLPGSVVHLLHHSSTGQSLGGDDLHEAQQWIRRVLQPLLLQLAAAGKPAALNFTGGTKALALALLQGHPWQYADYRAQGRRELQVIALQRDAQQVPDFQSLPDVPLADISPLEVALLHGNDVHPAALNELMLAQPQLTGQLAGEIWAALKAQDPGLLQLLARLEWLWSHQLETPAYRKNQLTLPWSAFLGSEAPLPGLDDWLRRFQRLAPEQLHWNDDSITLPGNRARRKNRALRDWISGTWLEQLIHQWLLEAGVPERAMVRNLKSGLVADNSHGERETDLLIHHQSMTCLIEAKADLRPGGSPAELERQVSSLGDRFGKTRKILMIGPQLHSRLQQGNRWNDFELRCKASGVALCTDREGLLDKVLKPAR